MGQGSLSREGGGGGILQLSVPTQACKKPPLPLPQPSHASSKRETEEMRDEEMTDHSHSYKYKAHTLTYHFSPPAVCVASQLPAA